MTGDDASREAWGRLVDVRDQRRVARVAAVQTAERALDVARGAEQAAAARVQAGLEAQAVLWQRLQQPDRASGRAASLQDAIGAARAWNRALDQRIAALAGLHGQAHAHVALRREQRSEAAQALARATQALEKARDVRRRLERTRALLAERRDEDRTEQTALQVWSLAGHARGGARR